MTTDTKVCAQCKTAPATTTRPTGVWSYFSPRATDPVTDLCDTCAKESDREIRNIHLDWQQEW